MQSIALCELPGFSSFSLLRSLDASFSPKRLFRIAFAIGSIIAVEAVLLNHMDRKEVVNIIPKISLEGRKIKFNNLCFARSILDSSRENPMPQSHNINKNKAGYGYPIICQSMYNRDKC